MELVPDGSAGGYIVLGELGLNGEIKKVKGVLPIVQEAAKSGIRRVVVPGENAMEAAVIPGITVPGCELSERSAGGTEPSGAGN